MGETIERIMTDQSGSLTDLQNNLDQRLGQLLQQTTEHHKQIEDNTSKISAIGTDVTQDIVALRQQFDNLKVDERDERELLVTRIESRIKEENSSLESHFKSLESRVESYQSNNSQQTSRLEKVEQYIYDRINEDENILARLNSLEKSGLEHERHLAELEQTTGEKTGRLELDLGRFRENQAEQLKSLSLGQGSTLHLHQGSPSASSR